MSRIKSAQEQHLPHIPEPRYGIREDDLAGDQARALLALHLAGMHAASPPGTVFALDLSGLTASGVTVWTAWDDQNIAGIGALKRLSDGSAEVKSMRTHPDYLRRGIAELLLLHVIAAARSQGVTRLSLETGTSPEFEAAHALYLKHGFIAGAPFADYEENAFSRFFHLAL